MFVTVMLVPEGRETRDDDGEGQEFDPRRNDDGLARLCGFAYEVESTKHHRPLGPRLGPTSCYDMFDIGV